ncbi:MAG: hypothetical protein IV100_29220 [Myxococcales bacterium]|nr:hypothetical protein [Myxococcales bacterium]
MNPNAPINDGEHPEPTADERRDADALRAYLDGTGPSPGVAEAGAVGLLATAGAAMARTRPAPLTSSPLAALRRAHDRRARRPYGAAFALAAAAILAFFLWPRTPVAPPGATPELHARAVEALASTKPVGERLSALHALAAAARERLVYDMAHEAAASQLASLPQTRFAAVVRP